MIIFSVYVHGWECIAKDKMKIIAWKYTSKIEIKKNGSRKEILNRLERKYFEKKLVLMWSMLFSCSVHNVTSHCFYYTENRETERGREKREKIELQENYTKIFFNKSILICFTVIHLFTKPLDALNKTIWLPNIHPQHIQAKCIFIFNNITESFLFVFILFASLSLFHHDYRIFVSFA